MIKGFTCSAFDFLHSGHVVMLKEAKEHCDYLIVGLHTNPQIDRPEKNKPCQSILERYIQLRGCKYIDEIIPYDTEEDLLNLLQIIKPDVRIIGEEYKDKDFTGKELNIPLYYNSRKHNYSSSSLIKRLDDRHN
jgi:glycerol-3-phosphate cytidylyltransferase